MRPRRRARPAHGFSVIELLMVMFIIAIIVGIIVPALGSGRESARRIQCVNNLRQIGLALQNYETTYRVLPPGVVNPTGPIHNWPDDFHIGWVNQILPYLEQYALAQVFDPEAPVYAPQNLTTRRSRLNTLTCPAEPRMALAPPGGFGASDYAGCHHDVEAPIDADNHGVFFLNSHIGYPDLFDGSSTTIFVGEKRDEPSDLGWMSGTRATLRNTGTPINATPIRPLPDSTKGVAAPENDRVGGFGSHHRGGANFAFGDGSVRFLSETIRPDVLRLLGHRADGEMIDGDAF